MRRSRFRLFASRLLLRGRLVLRSRVPIEHPLRVEGAAAELASERLRVTGLLDVLLEVGVELELLIALAALDGAVGRRLRRRFYNYANVH